MFNNDGNKDKLNQSNLDTTDVEKQHLEKIEVENEMYQTNKFDTELEQTESNDGPINEMQQPRRLHPAAMFFNLVKLIKETILGFGIGLVITFQESFFYFTLFVSIFIVIVIASSVLSWLRFTYRVEDGELRIEEGVFVRKKRYISINRIHKIDLTANVVHRIFKLTKVQIDTASSGGGAEVNLSAVKVSDGEKLREALKKVTVTPTTETEDEEKVDNPEQKISWKRLFIAGTTSGSAGIIIAALLAGFSQIQQLIPDNVYDATFNWVIGLGLVLIVLFSIVALFVLWLLGIAGTMIKYGNFTIEKREKELFIKRGLLETKELTIPFDRIQAIGVEQTLIRQPIKFVQVFAVVAGGSFDKMEPFPVLFPIMRESEVSAFLEKFVPEHQMDSEKIIPLSKRGRKFYLFNASVIFFLALIPVLYFFPTFSWIPIILIIFSLWFGWLQHKDGGYYIDGKKLILRKRNINKVMIATYHHRIQSLEKKQHFLQRKLQLATTGVALIGLSGLGTNYSLTHLEDDDANKIADWYSYRKKADESDSYIENEIEE